jgi:hypothetical protein
VWRRSDFWLVCLSIDFEVYGVSNVALGCRSLWDAHHSCDAGSVPAYWGLGIGGSSPGAIN